MQKNNQPTFGSIFTPYIIACGKLISIFKFSFNFFSKIINSFSEKTVVLLQITVVLLDKTIVIFNITVVLLQIAFVLSKKTVEVGPIISVD